MKKLIIVILLLFSLSSTVNADNHKYFKKLIYIKDHNGLCYACMNQTDNVFSITIVPCSLIPAEELFCFTPGTKNRFGLYKYKQIYKKK